MTPRTAGYRLPWNGSFSGIPDFKWSVSIHAHCAECGGEAIVGTKDTGGTHVVCTRCKKQAFYEQMSLREAAAKICTKAAVKTFPPATQ